MGIITALRHLLYFIILIPLWIVIFLFCRFWLSLLPMPETLHHISFWPLQLLFVYLIVQFMHNRDVHVLYWSYILLAFVISLGFEPFEITAKFWVEAEQ